MSSENTSMDAKADSKQRRVGIVWVYPISEN